MPRKNNIDEPVKKNITVILDECLLRKIDDFRFGYRHNSRSAAMGALIKIGLESMLNQESEAKPARDMIADESGPKYNEK